MGKKTKALTALPVTGQTVSGVIKTFDYKKGYGLIEVDGYSNVFVRKSAVNKAGLAKLDEGDIVTFVLAVDPLNTARTVATQLQVKKVDTKLIASSAAAADNQVKKMQIA